VKEIYLDDGVNPASPPQGRRMPLLEDQSKTYILKKGYDPTLPPIRERFAFLPELELDGSPRVELIVGRRPIVKGRLSAPAEDKDDADHEHHEDAGAQMIRRRNTQQHKTPTNKKGEAHGDDVGYEYLIKYKGKSYLHLDWKTAADLESMNKSAKTLYLRYLKKLAAGTEENLEDQDFDPSYAQPQKVVDEAEHEVTAELTDKELIPWEKEREKEMEEEEDEDEEVKVPGVEEEPEDEKKEEDNVETGR
jgi:hypothetical protein